MKILISWLREFVDIPVGLDELTATMAMRGFQLEGREDGLAGGLAAGDTVVDFEVTTNRPDCLSVLGFAREVSAAFDVPLRRAERHALDSVAGDGAPPLRVDIEEPELCPRYAAALAEVRVGPSPGWMAARLHSCGIRPINAIVDVTNYVLLEMGHPMHAFDHAGIAGAHLRVRLAESGERIRTLDGVDRVLSDDMLVIADAVRPVAIAGVMGGSDSEVAASTKVIALESAWFKPQSVRRTGKRLNLSTEASYRFERGADLEAPARAIERAVALLVQTGAGRPLTPIIDRYPQPHQPVFLTLRAGRIRQILGRTVKGAEVARILERLGFGVPPASPGDGEDEWRVGVPSWRGDVTREIDLIEEVARHHGYDRLPDTFPALRVLPSRPDPRIARDGHVRRYLTGAGFSEASTFAFVDRSAARPFADEAELLELANPLSEKFSVMRPSLLPGLIDAAGHNRRRERADVRLFEVGTRFSRRTGETRAVGAVWLGAAAAADWSQPARCVDFFDMKGVAAGLCTRFGVDADVQPVDRRDLAPGEAAALLAWATSDEEGLERRLLGVVGRVAAALAAEREIPAGEPVYVAELDLDALASLAPARHRHVDALPRHPSVVRDLSIVVDETLPAATVRGTIRAAAPPTLVNLYEFGRYQGRGVPAGRVSLSFRLTFRAADRTLVDAEVQQALDRILLALEAGHGAELR